MDPIRKLARLCRRHDVPYEDAEHLLPLVRRAAEVLDRRMQKSLLNVVESTLARLGEERRHRARLEEHLNRQYMIAVASVLHRWRAAIDPPSSS